MKKKSNKKGGLVRKKVDPSMIPGMKRPSYSLLNAFIELCDEDPAIPRQLIRKLVDLGLNGGRFGQGDPKVILELLKIVDPVPQKVTFNLEGLSTDELLEHYRAQAARRELAERRMGEVIDVADYVLDGDEEDEEEYEDEDGDEEEEGDES
jgi:hypothetical protein